MSSKKLRQSQHRPARETVKAKELADLRRENHKLARTAARLSKQLQKATEQNHAFTPEEEAETPVANALTGGGNCPTAGCNGTLKRLELGPKVIEVCPECKFRRAAA